MLTRLRNYGHRQCSYFMYKTYRKIALSIAFRPYTRLSIYLSDNTGLLSLLSPLHVRRGKFCS